MKTNHSFLCGIFAAIVMFALAFTALSLTGCPNEPAHVHDSGEWHVTKAATCTETGTKELRCTVDNFVLDTDTIAIDPDAHDYQWTENQPADGIEKQVCSINGSHIGKNRTVMVFVEGGAFQLGKDLGTAATGDVTPVSNVTLSDFFIGKYEVTQAQWQAVMERTITEQQALATTSTTNRGRSDDRPIYYANWYEAIVFCNKLSVREGLPPAYRISNSANPDDWGTVPASNTAANKATWDAVEVVSGSTGYRLPTEAQWEYAAKGGNTGETFAYAGSDNPDEVAWHNNNSGDNGGNTNRNIHVVGTKSPNGLDLYDMIGNISERCWDWAEDYTSEDKTDPTGPPLV